MSVHQKIHSYYNDASAEHHRYRSWEHCYAFFRNTRSKGLAENRDHAALQLAFYLASWGMYRGSSFLLRHAYTVHRGVIDLIAQPQFNLLWQVDFGTKASHKEFIPTICALIEAIRQEYKPFAQSDGSSQPTDTLITKVLLGTFGCLPACDRYFLDGFKSQGFKYRRLNEQFVDEIHSWCQAHLAELQNEQSRILTKGGMTYPLMKLVDMYFWQIGYEG